MAETNPVLNSMNQGRANRSSFWTLLISWMPWLEPETPLLPCQEAAILLEYARDGQDLNGSNLTLRSRNCYRLRHRLQWFARLAAWGMVFLHILERPTWTYKPSREDFWKDHHLYPSFQITYLNPVAVNILTALCLAVLWWMVRLDFGYKRFTNNVNLVYFSAVVLAIKSITVLGCLIKLAAGNDPTFSASPVEALMCLLIEQQYDNNIGYIRRTVPKFGVLMLALACFICTYTAVGFLIFDPDFEERKVYFPTYGTALWNMLMVLNGSNWPSPMLPAFQENRLYCIYFYSFIILVGWGLLNLVLGFVYLFFQQEQQAIVELQELTRRDNKAAAFRLLDVEKKGFLTYTQVDELLTEMYQCYEDVREPPTAAERYELLLVLDIQSNLMIDENDFSFIEQKCFSPALKRMRAKKRKFTRYLSACILRDRLYARNSSDGRSGEDGVSGPTGSVQQTVQGATVSPLQQALDAERDNGATEGTNSLEHKPVPSSTDSTGPDYQKQGFPPQFAAALARAHAAALANEVGAIDTRLSTEPLADQRTDRSDSTLRDTRLSSAFEGAMKYAGKFEDPKLLELYRSLQKRDLMQQNSDGPTFTQYVAYYSMLIDTIYFDIAVDCFMLFVGFGVLTQPENTSLANTYLAFSMCEMAIKLFIKGGHRYWRGNRTSVDGLVTLGLLMLRIADTCVSSRAYSEVGTKALVLLRTLVFPRNIIVTNGFKAFRERHRLAFSYAFQSAGHFTFLVLVLVVMIYIFAGVGAKIFGGAICLSGPGAERVADSTYGESGYYPLNFNDMPSGMVTMFTLLTVNNMHITTSGFVAAQSQWAEVFFACWYALGVLLMLNVLTAVFVNQYTGYIRRLAEEKRLADEQRLEEELEQQDREAAAAALGADGTQLVRSQSEDSVNSTGMGAEAKKNTLLNARSLGHGSGAVAAAGGGGVEEDGSYIGMPSSNAPPGVLFSPPRLSSSAAHRDSAVAEAARSSNTSDGQRRSAPSPVLGTSTATAQGRRSPSMRPKAGSIVASSQSGLGLLVKMLTVEDTPSSFGIDPVDDVPRASFAPIADTSLVPGRRGSAGAAPRRPSARSDAPLPLPTPVTVSPAAAAASGGLTGHPAISRPRSSTTAVAGAGLATEDSQAAHSFGSSIFANNSFRRQLQGWMQASVPRPRNPSAGTATEAGVTETSYGAVEPRAPSPSPTGPSGEGSGKRGTVTADSSLQAQQVLSRLVVPADSTRLVLDDERDSDSESEYGGTSPTFVVPQRPPVPRPGNLSDYSNSSTSALHAALGGAARVGTAQRIVGGAVDSQPHFELTPSNSRKGSDADLSGPPLSPGSAVTPSAGLVPPPHTPSGITAAITSSEEELQSLRKKKNGTGMLGSLRSQGRAASLHDWMYSSNQITPAEKAAVLIQFARDGEEHSIFNSPRGLACFRLRTSLSPLFKACSFFYALVKFFQRPLWTYYHDQWGDNHIYPSSGMPQWSAVVIGAIKLPILLVLLFGLLLELGYKESSVADMCRRVNGMRLARYALLVYCVVQIVLVLVAISGGPPHLVPISSFGCILYVLWFNRRSLHKFRIVLRVLPNLSFVLAAFLFLVVLFAAFGPFLFNLRDSGEDDDMHQVYFDSFQDSTWSVFVAITSSNYPNQIMPAYRETREVFLYFFAFICLGAFGMLNLILVTVLVEFQKASQLAADIQRASRQVLLMRAFEVLDVKGQGYIERQQVQLLLDELYEHYADFKKAGVPRGAAREILIDILDVDGDGRITVPDFLFFLEVTRIKVSTTGGDTFMEQYLPGVVASAPFQLLKRVVLYHYTNLIVDTVAALTILIGLLVNYDNTYKPTVTSVAIAFTLVEILAFEAVCKILVLGVQRYRRSFRNRIDFCLSMGALVCLIGAGIYRHVSDVNGFTILMRVLLMLRLFMYPRNLRYFFESRGLKRFARLLRRILSKTLTLGIVFLCTGYVFATFGMFMYGGLIDRSPQNNPDYDNLVNSRFGQAGFYPLNFNDFMSACLTLFCCLHVSDFDTVTSGFTATTTEHTKLYFAAWYVVGVLLMLNILKSFFLGEFLALFLAPGAQSLTGEVVEQKTEGLQGEDGQSNPDSTAETDQDQPKPPDSTSASAAADMRDTYVLNDRSATGMVRELQAAGPNTSTGAALRLNILAQRQVSVSSSAAPSRQASTASVAGAARIRSISKYRGPHEYDEDQYRKIAFTRTSVSTDRGHQQQLHLQQSGPAVSDHPQQPPPQQQSTRSYVASTARVKNLNLREREILRRRIRQLAEAAAYLDDHSPSQTGSGVAGGTQLS